MDSPSDDEEPTETTTMLQIPTSKKPDAKQYERVPEWISNRNNLLKSPYNSNTARKKYLYNAPNDEEDVVKVFFDYKKNAAATTNDDNNNINNSNSNINTCTRNDGTIPLNRSSFGTATERSMMSSNGSSGWSTPDEAEITPSETSTTSSSSSTSASSSSSSASPLSPVRSPFRSPLLLQQQPPQSPEMKSESNRTEGQSESVATMIEESNRTERHSKETPTMDAEIVSSESHRTASASATLRSTSTSTPSPYLPHIFSSDIESSATATEKSMISNEAPSSRSTTLRDTVPRILQQQEQQPNEKDNGDKDDENDDTTSVASSSSHHTDASFWGNPVRFANPLVENNEAEEDTSSQNAITDEADNTNDREARNLELLVRDRPWMFVPTTKSNANPNDETDILLDPPAAMDGSLRDTSNTRYRSRQTTDRSDWMPPVSAAEELNHLNHLCDDDTMSVVTATIAETMKRLTQQQDEDQTKYCISDKIIPTMTSDSCAVVVEGTTRTGGGSRRIDFAGQTTSHGFSGERHGNSNNESENNRDGQKNEGSINSHKRSRKSQSKKIRKYYDNGRKASEKMRCQYMPTAAPLIADPHSDAESLYDWVPEEVKSQLSSRQGDYDSDDDDEYIDVMDDNDIESDDDDEDEDIAIYTDTDVEANRSTVSNGYGGKLESGSSLYDEISIVESEKDHQSRMENDEIGFHSARDDHGKVAAAAFPAPPSDTNYVSEKPSRIVHYVICLIIVSIPSVVFGIRFFAPR